MNEYRKWKWYEILAFLPHISCWCAKVYACQCCVCLPRNHSETPIKHQNVLHSLLINNSLSFFQYHSSPCENWPLPPIPQKKKDNKHWRTGFHWFAIYWCLHISIFLCFMFVKMTLFSFAAIFIFCTLLHIFFTVPFVF